ncbi:hypothetical protein SAY87_024559 [Trapa incisa]|uniref:Uncharacterized protein n=1 Tax=Trapa incisa TaxID=236973 RepID=A0AAN7GD30_9MYRT|nr:hypothetical protein SAY87_024559 [Trapa incisa]
MEVDSKASLFPWRPSVQPFAAAFSLSITIEACDAVEKTVVVASSLPKSLYSQNSAGRCTAIEDLRLHQRTRPTLGLLWSSRSADQIGALIASLFSIFTNRKTEA